MRQQAVVNGEDLFVRGERQTSPQPSVADLSHCLAEEFAALSNRADSTSKDTIVVDVDILRWGLSQGGPDSSRQVEMALRFRLGLREEETTISLPCHSRRGFEVEDTSRREEVAQMDLAIGEAYRSCLEEIYLQFPPTRFLGRQASPSAFSQVGHPKGGSPSGSEGQDMRHRWGFGLGGVIPGTTSALLNPSYGWEYSYEPDTRKWSFGWGASGRKNSWDGSVLLGYGPKSEPSEFGRFLQGVVGYRMVNIRRSGAERAIYSDRILHVVGGDDYTNVFQIVGLRVGADWDWDRKGEYGWGLEASALATGQWALFAEDDPWQELRPDDIPMARIELKVAICMIL